MRFLAAFLVAIALSSPSLAQIQSEVPNFHQVDGAVYRSGKPSAGDVTALAASGIRSILTLETYAYDPDGLDAERAAAEAAGLKFFRVAMSPMPYDKPTLEQVLEALTVTTQPENWPILVHCYHGSDRTGLVIGAYHIRAHGWTADAAIADMRNFGHGRLFYWWDDLLYSVE